MKPSPVAGQLSWQFATHSVAAAITETGGHLAPVRFRLGKRTVEPYAIAPWAEEAAAPGVPPILQALRGDFFCAPFGNNSRPYRGEAHPPHGEPANSRWSFKSLREVDDVVELNLSLRTKVREGQVDKTIRLRQGHTALYCRHVLSGLSGKMNLGHHAMLKFPDRPGSGQINTSKIRCAQVVPTTLEDPAQRGYSSLKPGATFRRLDRVPSIFGKTADVSLYPARQGFEDILMISHADKPDFAWTTVTFPEKGYVWFSLKDPRVLQSTVCWISNGGRHYAPWNGRHLNVMGLEDVTSYFHYGLAESAAKNSFSERGVATTLTLHKNKPTNIRYIMGVAAIPRGFRDVQTLERSEGHITLTSSSGQSVRTPVDHQFLSTPPYET